MLHRRERRSQLRSAIPWLPFRGSELHLLGQRELRGRLHLLLQRQHRCHVRLAGKLFPRFRESSALRFERGLSDRTDVQHAAPRPLRRVQCVHAYDHLLSKHDV